MKKVIKICIIMFILMLSCSISYANEWTYLGKFVLAKDKNHCNDYLILNHLFPYQGQYNSKKFNVYYHHNHNTDFVGDETIGLGLQGKIVPLDNYGKEMKYSGLTSGTIVSDVVVQTKGSFGVFPKSFRIFDNVTHKEIFCANGQMVGEILYKGSAAECIVNITGPHRGFEFNQISGGEYYSGN